MFAEILYLNSFTEFLWFKMISYPLLSTFPMFSFGREGKPKIAGMERFLAARILDLFSVKYVKSTPNNPCQSEASNPKSVFLLTSQVIFGLGSVLEVTPGASLLPKT